MFGSQMGSAGKVEFCMSGRAQHQGCFLVCYFKLLLQSLGVTLKKKSLPFLVMWHEYTGWKLL